LIAGQHQCAQVDYWLERFRIEKFQFVLGKIQHFEVYQTHKGLGVYLHELVATQIQLGQIEQRVQRVGMNRFQLIVVQ
jgi:hypothetical protein